ncbi:hypothetical protein FPCIR_8067 [Fusarium pseudocircinatum]|uniref:Uncharacterized protein n=1 Tax=Fusarium pseudocircinatum TaxID=56676 RepID=A0A8H5L652_9HYPO|nr:hypothetical protein FPCIR_8067 [Fusarium pseudocircinatum]
MEFTSDGRKRSPAEMNCFRRAMGWRRLDLMRIFPQALYIPGPRHISKQSVKKVAPFALQKELNQDTGLEKEYFGQHLGQLPKELVNMIQSYCPGAYFWSLVQLRDVKWFLSPGKPVEERDISCIERWERGKAKVFRGEPLGDGEYLLISLDSDGICEIQRLPKPEDRRQPEDRGPNHDPLVKLRKYVLANGQDLESVKAYF